MKKKQFLFVKVEVFDLKMVT